MKKISKLQKKKKHKLVKRMKFGIGLFAGGVLGMLFAPKKGTDSRAYLKLNNFKNKIRKAQNKALEARDFLHDKILTASGRMHRLWTSVRKRFGM